MNNYKYILTLFSFFILFFAYTPRTSASGTYTFERGTTHKLTWDIVSDTRCNATGGGSGDYTAWSGYKDVNAGVTGQTFTLNTVTTNPKVLTCTSDSGASDSVTVTVQDCGGPLSPGTTWNSTSNQCETPAAPAPTVALAISALNYPGPVTYTVSGSNVQYTLSSGNGAQSCEVVDNSGTIIIDKSTNTTSRTLIADTPPGTYTFTSKCWSGTNGAGTVSVTDTDTLTVQCPSGEAWNTTTTSCVPIGSATANLTISAMGYPGIVAYGTGITYTLSSGGGAQSCEVIDNFGTIHVNKSSNETSKTITSNTTPPGSYTFTTNCWTGLGGTGSISAPDTDYLTVQCPSGEVWNTTTTACEPAGSVTAALSISAPGYPGNVTYGSTITFVLSSTGAQSCEVIDNSGLVHVNKANNEISKTLTSNTTSPGSYIFTTKCWSGTNGAGTVSVTDTDTLTVVNGGGGGGSCTNNATNFPQCDVCPTNSGFYWYEPTSFCNPCDNGGCSDCNADSGSPYRGCRCNNGGTDVPTCTPPPAPQASFTTTTACDISIGASTCTRSIGWTTDYLIMPPSVRQGATEFSTNYNGSQSRTLKKGANTFSIRHNGSTLANLSLTADCEPGGTWDSALGICKGQTGSIVMNKCTIPVGTSSCMTSISWTTNGFTGASKPYIKLKVNADPAYTNETVVSRLLSGSHFYNTKHTYSPRYIMYASDNTREIDRASNQALCAWGTTWDPAPSVCVNGAGSNTATVSAPSCIITSGNNRCNSSISWTTSALSTSYTRGIIITDPSGATTSANGTSGVSGTDINPIYYGTSTIQYVYNGVTLATTYASARCAAGDTYDGTRCATIPVPDLAAGTVYPNKARTDVRTAFISTISNIGLAGATTTQFPVIFQIQTAGAPIDVGPATVGALGGGGATTTSAAAYTFTSAGTYQVRACANRNNNTEVVAQSGPITETNNANNCSAWAAVTVSDTGIGLDVPDCTITAGNPTCEGAPAYFYGTTTGSYYGYNTTSSQFNSNLFTSPNYRVLPPLTSSSSALQIVYESGNDGSDGNLILVTNNTRSIIYAATIAKATCAGGTSWGSRGFCNGSPNLTFLNPIITSINFLKGSLINFSAQVLNSGTGFTPQSFYNFLEVFNQITRSDEYHSDPIISDNNNLGLNPGQSFYPAASSVINTASIYSMIGCGDKSDQVDTGRIVETNENDNCGVSDTFAIYGDPGIDLIAGMVSTLSGKINLTSISIAAGTPTTFYVATANIGSVSPVGTTTVYRFFQVSNDLDGLGSVTDLPNPTGSQASLYMPGRIIQGSKSHTFTLPGLYSIRACVDKSNSSSVGVITETNEDNNCGPWLNISVTDGPVPDLIAGSLFPVVADPGVPQNYSAFISNIGTGPTSGTYQNFMQVMDGMNGTGNSIDEQSITVSSILASGSTATTTKTNYQFSSTGIYSARICADKANAASSGVLDEINEDNNCGTWTNISVGTVGSCLPGEYGDATTCHPCTPGSYCAGGPLPPVLCPVNTYCDGGNTPPGVIPKPPVPCAPGEVAPIGSVDANACTAAEPDLIVLSVATVPSPPSEGLSSEINFTIRNKNTNSTGEVFPNHVEIADGPGGTGNIIEKTYIWAPTLAGNSNYIATTSHIFPVAGTYSIRACADQPNSVLSGSIVESNEGNNCSVAWTDITVTSGSVCLPGEQLNGSGNCVPCVAGSYCAGGPTPPVLCPINTYCTGGNTPPGGTNPPVACPLGTIAPAGSTNVAACVVSTDPDLIVSDAQPRRVVSGATITYYGTITNQGGISTGAGFNNMMQVNDGLDGGGMNTVDLPTYNGLYPSYYPGLMKALPAGRSTTTSQERSFTSNGSLRFCTDKADRNDSGLIDEGNTGGENNNCGVWVNIIVGGIITCASGQYDNGSGTCVPCTAGNYCPGPSTPVPCPVDTYCTGTNTPPGGVKPPEFCPAGTTSPVGSTSILACTSITKIIAAPSSCLIATGNSTCDVLMSWTVFSPIGMSAVTRDGTAGNLYLGDNVVNKTVPVPYESDGTVVYRLYNNALELGSTTILVDCAAGSTKWDSIGQVCADPQVGSVIVNNDFGIGGPGSLDITCSGSNGYVITKDGVLFAQNNNYSGPWPKNIPIVASGNYSVVCKHGTVESLPIVKYYSDSAPANTPVISVTATPKTIEKGGVSAISWDIAFPVPACAISARPVCANNTCTQTQTQDAAAVNETLRTGHVDQTPGSSPGDGGLAQARTIAAAINTIAPGHETTDRKALGKKTLQIKGTTDLTIDCGGGKKATTRVRVAVTNEQ